ncbi:MAG: hypothetical protein M3Y64_06600 [Gemmatimonadota bacterium]|nr:hypothetical protein [Gemmatimonadota bacterium]
MLPPASGRLALGTWGGDNAVVIATDSVTHIHFGCTFGDMPPDIVLDANGKFAIDGSYLLRAYPIAVGPTVPAHFVGQVLGNTLTVSATVNDTIGKAIVALGPVTLVLGKTASMGPCPICAAPKNRFTRSEFVKSVARRASP